MPERPDPNQNDESERREGDRFSSIRFLAEKLVNSAEATVYTSRDYAANGSMYRFDFVQPAHVGGNSGYEIRLFGQHDEDAAVGIFYEEGGEIEIEFDDEDEALELLKEAVANTEDQPEMQEIFADSLLELESPESSRGPKTLELIRRIVADAPEYTARRLNAAELSDGTTLDVEVSSDELGLAIEVQHGKEAFELKPDNTFFALRELPAHRFVDYEIGVHNQPEDDSDAEPDAEEIMGSDEDAKELGKLLWDAYENLDE